MSAREALRSATERAHLRMHSLRPFGEIASGRLAPGDYCRLLRSLFEFHSAVAMVAERCRLASISSSGRRLELLAADLGDLQSPVPQSLPSWDPGEGSAALGAIYVAEGSAIGGRLVARQLDYLFGSAIDGRRFFAGLGKQDSKAWQQLLMVLEERVERAGQRALAIEGALAAFDLFERCVNSPDSKALRPPIVGLVLQAGSAVRARASRFTASQAAGHPHG